jgi:predicted phosphodiesterase
LLANSTVRIAALSDFHIGSTHRSDCFRHREDDFLRFLDGVEQEHDVIVLLGDIYQAEHGWSASAKIEARELHRARARFPRLCARFSEAGYQYVFGNHDKIAEHELGAVPSVYFEDDGLSVILTHGHQFDPLLRRIYPLARASTWFSGRLRYAGLRRLPDWLEHHDIVIKHRRFHHESGPYLEGARQLTRTAPTFVVMGHTHMPMQAELGGGHWLGNTGTCSMGQKMLISIDTRERRMELRS